MIPFKTHLVLDLAAAVVFITAPFVFGSTGLVTGYYFVMAAGVTAVVALTNPHRATVDEPSVSAGA